MYSSKAFFIALVIAAGGACSHHQQAIATAPVTGPAEGDLPFIASSVSSRFAIKGQFEGLVLLKSDTVVVTVLSGLIRGRIRDARGLGDVRLSAQLAFGDTAGTWDTRGESVRVTLSDAFPSWNTDLAHRVRFAIPLKEGMELSKQWVVFAFEWPCRYQGTRTLCSAYAHSNPTLFAHLKG